MTVCSVPSPSAVATITIEYDDDLAAGAATLLAVLWRREPATGPADEAADSPADEERPTAA